MYTTHFKTNVLYNIQTEKRMRGGADSMFDKVLSNLRLEKFIIETVLVASLIFCPSEYITCNQNIKEQLSKL